jgi:hypothetical protein
MPKGVMVRLASMLLKSLGDAASDAARPSAHLLRKTSSATNWPEMPTTIDGDCEVPDELDASLATEEDTPPT